jgi:hypothetical protein
MPATWCACPRQPTSLDDHRPRVVTTQSRTPAPADPRQTEREVPLLLSDPSWRSKLWMIEGHIPRHSFLKARQFHANMFVLDGV